MFIRKANDQMAVMVAGGYRQFVAREVYMRWRGMAPNWQIRGQVKAEIIHSDWAAKCPFCRGAMVIQPDEPFYCVDCAMQANEGCCMEVVWPPNREAIEAILMFRPDPATRNWSSKETVQSLMEENTAHYIQ